MVGSGVACSSTGVSRKRGQGIDFRVFCPLSLSFLAYIWFTHVSTIRGFDSRDLDLNRDGEALFEDNPSDGWGPEGWFQESHVQSATSIGEWQGMMLKWGGGDAGGRVDIADLRSGR